LDDIELLGKYFSRIHRHSMAHLDKRLRHLGIGGGQFGFMMTLYRKDGINQSKLSDLLKLDKTTIARSIRPLIENGYVVRERDLRDRRGYRILLTERGRSIRPELIRIQLELESELLEGLSPEDREQLIGLLRKITENAARIK